jgi:hypothetical protein
MKKFKLSLVACYTLLTFFLPFALVILCMVMVANRQMTGDWNAVWRVVDPLFSLILPVPYLLVPVGVNLVFGPSIIAYLSHKRSRAVILILNLISVVWFWMTRDTPFDVLGWSLWLPFGLMVLLCAWACWERASASAADSTSTVVILMIVHVCAIGWVHYGLYKSPEQRVAEAMLKHRTIKWKRGGKTECFVPPPYYGDEGSYYEGPLASELRFFESHWQVNAASRQRYTLWYGDDGLTIHMPAGEDRHISYEQLFQSKEIELIDSHKFNAQVEDIAADKPVPSTVDPLGIGPGIPGAYGWEYDALSGHNRYWWDYYFEGVRCRAIYGNDYFVYANIYPDHTDSYASWNKNLTHWYHWPAINPTQLGPMEKSWGLREREASR